MVFFWASSKTLSISKAELIARCTLDFISLMLVFIISRSQSLLLAKSSYKAWCVSKAGMSVKFILLSKFHCNGKRAAGVRGSRVTPPRFPWSVIIAMLDMADMICSLVADVSSHAYQSVKYLSKVVSSTCSTVGRAGGCGGPYFVCKYQRLDRLHRFDRWPEMDHEHRFNLRRWCECRR